MRHLIFSNLLLNSFTDVFKPAVNYGIYDTDHLFVSHHQEFGVSW